ncbi:MAG: ABC-F family ATP-binding cassette domain-containing protein [Bacteroidales bacterium]|nr:ATP-binding cassette domain-containing protein [Bacteroidales bacterium]MDD4603768.1 ABC-F family ATP-binding cassette domain-containing protein [Bacteroidales bacterium]
MSSILQVENLARSYGEKELFENISFVISKGQKVALIARNGAGKTSLLNIIAGLEPCDAGSVTNFCKDSFEYLMQEPELIPDLTVFEAVYSHANDIQRTILHYEHVICTEDKEAIQKAIEAMDAIQGWEYETRVKQILTQLKLPNLDQRIRELSGGQKKRVALAKTLITEPQFLILDEPTNHLDVEMIEWLEEYLSKTSITLFMVTHDRYFLDRVCDEILEMENAAIYRYKGNYSYFLEKQAERIDNQNKEVERAQNLLRTEQEWMRRMPKARTTKAKARIDSFYDLKTKAESKIYEERLNLNIEGARMGKKILEINDITFSWGNNTPILKGFTYIFKRFEKIGIVGKNGSGKSTFLDIITSKIRPQKGHIQTGETIQFGYYKQQGLVFDQETKVIDVVKEIAEVVKLGNGDTISASAFLNYFMFPYPSHYQPVYKLSGGEKRRLYLITVLMRSPNFLILDEPTNDLDILTLNVLEEYLATFNGCVVVVTHDRYFLDKIVDHLFVFEGDAVIKDFPGNYTQYKIWSNERKKKEQLQKRTNVKKTETEKKIVPVTNKLSFKEKRELETLELEIEKLEAEKSGIEAGLQSGNLKPEELTQHSQRFAALLIEISDLTDRWLELSERESSLI